jgi:hypothetical protein
MAPELLQTGLCDIRCELSAAGVRCPEWVTLSCLACRQLYHAAEPPNLKMRDPYASDDVLSHTPWRTSTTPADKSI